jgi:alanine dehydrogenase
LAYAEEFSDCWRASLIIGVPKEIKSGECRVALTPAAARELVQHGHDLLVEAEAGVAAGIQDADFLAEGATVVPAAADVWRVAELIVKVKEPQLSEIEMLGPDQALFAYLHLAPDRAQTEALTASGAMAIAFETVTDARGRLPLLAPMSEVAGRLAAQFGAMHLLSGAGGRGILAAGVPGVAPARAVVIGGGVVGTNAARVALGTGFEVSVVDRQVERLRELDAEFGGRVRTIAGSERAVERELETADLVIGAVLAPGGLAPCVLRREHLQLLGAGAVIVDVAIDQGGCFATSRPTTHAEPTFVLDGVVHNCVANLPGAVPRTSTYALVNAILPYVLKLATDGPRRAMDDDPGLADGLNVADGQVMHPAVAAAHGLVAPVPSG